MRKTARAAIPLGTFVVSGAFFLLAGQFVESSTFSTTNGLWKALEARDWLSGNGELNTANLLFIGVFAILTSWADLYDAPPTETLVLFNSFSVALTSAILSSTLISFTNRARWGLLGGLGFAFAGGSLTHALGSEDIAGALPLIALIIRVVLHRGDRQLHPGEIAKFGSILAFLHLWEWRAALPLYLAVLLSFGPALGFNRGGKIKALAAMAVGWSVTMFLTYTFLVQVFALHLPSYGFLPESFFMRFLAGAAALAFPAKGIGTIWGGFSPDKFGYQLIGMSEAVVGGRNVSVLSFDYSVFVIATVMAVYFFTLVGLVYLYRLEGSRGAALFLGLILGGALLLNLYSQPQDPQMQVTQLPILFVLATLGLRAVIRQMRSLPGGRVESIISMGALATYLMVSVTNFQGSSHFWTGNHSSDRQSAEEARLLLEAFDDENYRAVIGQGWEPNVTWLAYEAGGLNFLGHGKWDAASVNALFAVDFISADPDGTPDDWLCAAVSVSAARENPRFFPISKSVSWNFDSFQTIVPLDKARLFEASWKRVFVSDQFGFFKVDRVAAAEICSAKSEGP